MAPAETDAGHPAASTAALGTQHRLARRLLVVTVLATATIALSLLAVVAAAGRMGWEPRFDGVVPHQVPNTPQVIGALVAAIACTATVLVVVVRHAIDVASFTFRKGDH